MTVEIIVVLSVLALTLLTLALSRVPADVLLMAALTALLAIPVRFVDGWPAGVLTAKQALGGFANPGLGTVGILFIVVRGLRETGGVDFIAQRMLGRPANLRSAIAHVLGPVWAMSVFLNNTPVVAMMIPAINDWARKLKFAPSKLMIPLSYAAILGGTCSLIGTSTNLVVAGLVISHTDLPALGMFDITWIGLPAALAGIAFLLFVGPKLLPTRQSAMQVLADPRQYTLEMLVPLGSALANKTVEEAGLRNLPGCFLIEIERGDEAIAAVGPSQVLHENDRLVFAGVVEAIKELQNLRGLLPATDQVFKLDAPRHHRRLYEAVVSPACPIVDMTIRDGRFRSRYGGAVLAIARHGERVRGKIGDIILKPGDVLLLESDPGFGDRYRDSRDFLLVSLIHDSTPRRHERAWIAMAILGVMIALVTVGVFSMLTAALLAAGAMVALRCCTIGEARQSVDWSVLIVIGAAFGIGEALDQSGAAKMIADNVITLAGGHPWLALLAVYVVTSFFTEIITNNAAVALVFPIALVTANQMDVNFMPFVIAIMMAGSASFATPLGYQTNLMVYGPGGYTVKDFLRIGLPMNFIMGAVTVALTPLVFPF